MPYVVVEDFRAGLDSRRDIISGPAGSLNDLVNAHITRGGDIEKRKAFVPTFNLPLGTFHAQAAKDQLFVFGSDPAPGSMPDGVGYQRLQHPDGFAMTRIVMTKVIEGKIYALAEFEGGSVLPFYDGALVTDWVNGIVRPSMVNVAGVAAHLASIIDAHPDFAATSVGADITITGAKNKAFAVEVTATNKDGGVNDQTITKTDLQTAVEDVAEVKATATFRILGGSAAAGVNQVTSVKVNAVEQLNAAVNWNGSNELTAQAVAASINANTAANPNFTAAADGDVVTLTAPAGSGATLNGANVLVTTAGNVITCIGSFTITDGSVGGTITSVKVNGVTITNATINYTTDNATTAALIAANINAFNSSPNYQAFANGPTVFLTDVTAEPDDPKNLTVALTVTGTVTATASSVSSTVTAPAGGRLATTGQPQITKVTIGGTFEPGDKYRIKLGDTIFGFDRAGEQTPVAILPLKNKVYIAAGSIMFFSGVGTPNKLNSDATGSGLINMSNEGGGFENLAGLGIFRNNVAALTRDTVQVWFVDADPLRNNQIQVLPNIGTIASNSVVTFGDNDIFFLSDTGIRSLRVRDTTENLSVFDVGTPIDDRVQEKLALMTDAEKALAVGAIEPTDGRFWLVLGGTIFVFSYFTASKISAWSIYDPGFQIAALTKLRGRIYARAGDTIYVYGGLPGNIYDSSRVRAVLPYLDANTPATKKQFSSIDAVVAGTWRVNAGTDPTIPDAREEVATLTQPTLNQRAIPFTGYGTHVGLEFISEAPGPAKLSRAIVHFDTAEDGATG